LDYIADEFTAPYMRKRPELENFSNATASSKEILSKMDALGAAQKDWLSSAIQNIGLQFDPDDVERYHAAMIRRDSAGGDKVDLTPEAPRAASVDTWEPLPIDRSSAAYAEAVESSDAALREIESSNGYAATEPEERNAIVSTIRGTLEAIKGGHPSRGALVHGLLKPLEYVAAKFRDATIGEIAKIAVTRILSWLATL
jgi:hypothetical protein